MSRARASVRSRTFRIRSAPGSGIRSRYGRVESGGSVPGFASLMVVVLLLGGIQLLCLGLLGGYVARTYLETKRRPLYIVAGRANFGPAWAPSTTPPPSSARPSNRSWPRRWATSRVVTSEQARAWPRAGR